jgi:hypothetical protein
VPSSFLKSGSHLCPSLAQSLKPVSVYLDYKSERGLYPH